jgi:hypothetical protein
MKFVSGTLRVDFSATAERFEMQISVYQRNSLGLLYLLKCHDPTHCGCGDNVPQTLPCATIYWLQE